MRVEINAVRLDLSDAIKQYAEQKIKSIEHIVQRMESGGEAVAFFEISRTTRHHKQGEVYYAEITLQLPHKTIRIEKTHDDVYGAIDITKDALKEEISRLKEKEDSKKRK